MNQISRLRSAKRLISPSVLHPKTQSQLPPVESCSDGELEERTGSTNYQIDAAPAGHWKTTTFVAGLRHTGIIAPLVLDGPMTGAWLRAYVEEGAGRPA